MDKIAIVIKGGCLMEVYASNPDLVVEVYDLDVISKDEVKFQDLKRVKVELASIY
jgi:hypothetical protein